MPDIVPAAFVTRPGADPHAAGADLREAGSVHPIDYPPGARAYVVVDHRGVVEAFNDPRLSKRLDNAPQWFRERTLATSPVITGNMLLADPPDHARLRGLVSRAFLPRRMERLRPRVQEITDTLVDAMPDAGEADLMAAFAFPLPLLVISEFIGVPPQDRARFQRWGHVLSRSPSEDGDEAAAERKLVNDEVMEYFTGILAERRAVRDRGPARDLLDDLVRAADEDGVFSDAELVSTLVFLVIAGHKTTANLVGNGMQALLRHPEQLAALREDPSLVVSAVEELLRFEGPVDRSTLRVAAEDLTLDGVRVPRESFVHLSIAAADRDPAVFPDPDRLDIARSPNRHVAFGHGPHFCAGAPLARLEGQVAFPTLLRRLQGLELAVPADDLAWIADSSISRGLEQLPVRYTRRLSRTEGV